MKYQPRSEAEREAFLATQNDRDKTPWLKVWQHYFRSLRGPLPKATPKESEYYRFSLVHDDSTVFGVYYEDEDVQRYYPLLATEGNKMLGLITEPEYAVFGLGFSSHYAVSLKFIDNRIQLANWRLHYID